MRFFEESGVIFLTTLASIAVMFLLTKLMGAKQVSQMTMFDYVVGITIGSIAAELATELENPEQPLIAMILYGAAAYGISVWTTKSLKVRSFFTGKPLTLMDNGIIYRKNLKKARMDLNEFLTFCRMDGYFDLSQIQTAILEHNGHVSFLIKEPNRPATPEDLKLKPQQTKVQIPFVMDGVLLTKNIRQAGKEDVWVRRTLQRKGFGDEHEVMLALWDGQSELYVYPATAQDAPRN